MRILERAREFLNSLTMLEYLDYWTRERPRLLPLTAQYRKLCDLPREYYQAPPRLLAKRGKITLRDYRNQRQYRLTLPTDPMCVCAHFQAESVEYHRQIRRYDPQVLYVHQGPSLSFIGSCDVLELATTGELFLFPFWNEVQEEYGKNQPPKETTYRFVEVAATTTYVFGITATGEVYYTPTKLWIWRPLNHSLVPWFCK
jgi:hypothetical protein